MRMRTKPNLGPRMERCSHLLVPAPEARRGGWREPGAPFSELHLELGCGKGGFTVAAAAARPDVLFVAMDRVPEAMVVAMERAAESGLTNLLFFQGDAARLSDCFAPGEVSCLYINFCDPWPRKRNEKRRLTSDAFLTQYRMILKKEGALRLKTDNAPLFAYSLERLEANGFRLSGVTRDLHAAGPAELMTDYERKFHALGTPICRCIATPE